MLPGHVVRGRPNPRHFGFAERLRRSLKEAGVSASGISLAAGLDKNTVSRLEAGPELPRLPTLEKLARTMGLSPAWLAFALGDAAAPAEQGPLGCAGLAARAKEARAALGLSMREVSRRAGTAFGSIRSIEHGGMPSLDLAEQVARALAVSPWWFCFGLGPREPARRQPRPEATPTGRSPLSRPHCT